MYPVEDVKVESEALSDFVKVMQAGTVPVHGPHGGDSLPASQAGQGGRLNLDQDSVKNGLGQLVLTLVKVLHELLERQACLLYTSPSPRDRS